MIRPARIAIFSGVVLAALAPLFAQGIFRFRGENTRISWEVRTAREIGNHSFETPEWTNPVGFERDVFTFARIRYDAAYGGQARGGGGWSTDAPDSDLNLSWRLQQITAMRTDPNGRVLRVTDPDLANYPFTYIVEPGRLSFDSEEIVALRRYLNNGGFLMLDDFWGDAAWENVARVFKQVLPDRNFIELPMNHPLYSAIFKISEKGQLPSINNRNGGGWREGVTWEGANDTRTVHHRVIFDDKGRLMVFAAHNTDNGDGWEREGEEPDYFEHFSLKYAYPLGINLIVYQMTH